MDDFNFDPRSWRPKVPGKAEPVPELAPDSAVGNAAETEQAGGSGLPEAWRGIGSTDAAEALATAPSRVRLASVTIALLLGAAAAGIWLSQTPSTEQHSAQGKPLVQNETPNMIERSLRISGSADIAMALTTLGIPADEAASAASAVAGNLTQSGEIHLTALLVSAGKTFTINRVQASYPDGSGAVIGRNAAGVFVATKVGSDLTSTIKFTPGEIDAESFYSSAVSAGLPDILVPEFINAFAYDFNLASQVTPGDTFEVAYAQSMNAGGEAVGQPELLYAKLTTMEKSLALYRFKQADGTIGWFDGNGASTKRGFMRTPVDGARITSKFGMRFHPTLHYNRLHGGVDFGAPIGTPIYAAADGVVDYAAAKGCNGNLTILRHDGGYQTYYLHQVRWIPDISVGTQVKQGQHIGDVGMTPGGICVTGPHLHYEVHLNGEKIDPLTIPTDAGKREKLTGAAFAGFVHQRDRIDAARAQPGL